MPSINLKAPATSLGAPGITVGQCGSHIFFGNAACALGSHSYCILFNDF